MQNRHSKVFVCVCMYGGLYCDQHGPDHRLKHQLNFEKTDVMMMCHFCRAAMKAGFAQVEL